MCAGSAMSGTPPDENLFMDTPSNNHNAQPLDQNDNTSAEVHQLSNDLNCLSNSTHRHIPVAKPCLVHRPASSGDGDADDHNGGSHPVNRYQTILTSRNDRNRAVSPELTSASSCTVLRRLFSEVPNVDIDMLELLPQQKRSSQSRSPPPDIIFLGSATDSIPTRKYLASNRVCPDTLRCSRVASGDPDGNAAAADSETLPLSAAGTQTVPTCSDSPLDDGPLAQAVVAALCEQHHQLHHYRGSLTGGATTSTASSSRFSPPSYSSEADDDAEAGGNEEDNDGDDDGGEVVSGVAHRATASAARQLFGFLGGGGGARSKEEQAPVTASEADAESGYGASQSSSSAPLFRSGSTALKRDKRRCKRRPFQRCGGGDSHAADATSGDDAGVVGQQQREASWSSPPPSPCLLPSSSTSAATTGLSEPVVPVRPPATSSSTRGGAGGQPTRRHKRNRVRILDSQTPPPPLPLLPGQHLVAFRCCRPASCHSGLVANSGTASSVSDSELLLLHNRHPAPLHHHQRPPDKVHRCHLHHDYSQASTSSSLTSSSAAGTTRPEPSADARSRSLPSIPASLSATVYQCPDPSVRQESTLSNRSSSSSRSGRWTSLGTSLPSCIVTPSVINPERPSTLGSTREEDGPSHPPTTATVEDFLPDVGTSEAAGRVVSSSPEFSCCCSCYLNSTNTTGLQSYCSRPRSEAPCPSPSVSSGSRSLCRVESRCHSQRRSRVAGTQLLLQHQHSTALTSSSTLLGVRSGLEMAGETLPPPLVCTRSGMERRRFSAPGHERREALGMSDGSYHQHQGEQKQEPLYEVNLITTSSPSSSAHVVSLVVDNVRFIVDPQVIQMHSDTMLGRMLSSQFPEASQVRDYAPPQEAGGPRYPSDIHVARNSNVSAQLFRAILDYYLVGWISCPPGVTAQVLKEACDYFLIPFNHHTVRCSNLRAFLHEIANDGAHARFQQFLESHILSLLVKCARQGEREFHLVIVTNDETIDWDSEYPPQMPDNELNAHIIYNTRMFRFLKYIENREVAKQVLSERGLKKIRIGIEGYPTSKDRVKFRPGIRPEAIYNYVHCPFLRMSWEEEENKSRHVDFQCVKSRSVSDLTTGLEQAVIDPLPPHFTPVRVGPMAGTATTISTVTLGNGRRSPGRTSPPLALTTSSDAVVDVRLGQQATFQEDVEGVANFAAQVDTILLEDRPAAGQDDPQLEEEEEAGVQPGGDASGEDDANARDSDTSEPA